MSDRSSGFIRRWYPVFLALIGVAASLAVYSQLPESIAVHWDIDGNPNGWMPRATGAFFSPALILVLAGLMRGLPRVDPRRANYARFGDAYETIIAAALALPSRLGVPVTLAAAVAALFGPAVYSYLTWKREQG